MGHREQVHGSLEGTDVGGATAVNTNTLGHDALTHNLLGQGLNGGLHFDQTVSKLGQLLDDGGGRGAQGLGTLGLGLVGVGGGQTGETNLFDLGVDVVGVVGERLVLNGLDRATSGDVLTNELALQVDGFADPEFGGFETSGQHFFGHLGGAIGVLLEGTFGATGFDHHDGDVGLDRVGQGAAGDDELEDRGVTFSEGRVRGPLAVSGVGHANGTNRALEGDARNHQRGRGGVDGQDVVRVFLVGAEDGADDLDLVAEALGEGRTQWAVDQTTDQDGLVRNLAFTTEERTGDLAGGVGALFDVHREGEEVDAVTNAASSGDGGQQDGVADLSNNGSVGELGESTSFK